MNTDVITAVAQIAASGAFVLGLTAASNLLSGKPPSRANANVILLVLVTVAIPQSIWHKNIEASTG
jgi:hypothetical protein